MHTLLLVDDESAVMNLLRLVLKEYNLIEATTAEEALRLFMNNHRQADLLIADLSLSTASGIQVALILRSEMPNLPVILISGYPLSSWTARDSTDLKRLGSNSVTVLQKPFYPQALTNAICKLIGAPPVNKAGKASTVLMRKLMRLTDHFAQF